jgi:3-deoxy-7-phosphoheptulonate synthase
MMIIVKRGTNEDQIKELTRFLEGFGVEVQFIRGNETTMLGLAGDTSEIDPDEIQIHEYVERVVRIAEPYKRANRKFHPENTIIDVKGRLIGGKKLTIIAGPCSVESAEQLEEVARNAAAAGASFLRGGAFKPRSSPYSFQGLGESGLDLLKEAGKKNGLPIVSEIISNEFLDLYLENVDVIQVGARNMQNFFLLKALGKTDKPILLKRGFSSTIDELLMAAEYIMSEGNKNVILCERGIRTFETYTRNTLDLSAIPVLKRLSHLPVIVDPSHATGLAWLVEPMSKAAIAAGADGLIIEVHNDPSHAKCDGPQSITPDSFTALMKKLALLAELEGREI